MRQKTVPTSLSIKLISTFVFLLLLVLLVSSLYEPVLIIAVIFLSLIILLCYLYAPVAYEINDNQLVVVSRINRKRFGRIVSSKSLAAEPPSLGIRLWGNGGLFAGTGIFWNKKYGIFRAYVTTGNRSDLVLVETEQTKIIISPQRPNQFISYSLIE